MFPDLKPPPAPVEGRLEGSTRRTGLKDVILPLIQHTTYTPLKHIDQLLPVIRNEIKESRSKAAHDILVRMALNNKLLLYELCAIRIQSLVRKFIARLRTARIRRRTELFMRITEDCANRYLEEFVLSSCLELSLEFYRHHRRFKLMQDSVEREIIVCIEQIQEEVITESIAEVAKETISDAIDVVVQLRHAAHLTKDKTTLEEAPPSPIKAVRANPLVTLVDTVVDEAVLLFIRGVACQAIAEEADEYLLQQKCDRIYALLVTETLLEVLVDVIQIYFAAGDIQADGTAATTATATTAAAAAGVEYSDALVGALYERIYAQHRTASKLPHSPTAPAGKLGRRSTYRASMYRGASQNQQAMQAATANTS